MHSFLNSIYLYSDIVVSLTLTSENQPLNYSQKRMKSNRVEENGTGWMAESTTCNEHKRGQIRQLGSVTVSEREVQSLMVRTRHFRRLWIRMLRRSEAASCLTHIFKKLRGVACVLVHQTALTCLITAHLLGGERPVLWSLQTLCGMPLPQHPLAAALKSRSSDWPLRWCRRWMARYRWVCCRSFFLFLRSALGGPLLHN